MNPHEILIPVNDAMVRDPRTKQLLSKDGEMKPLVGGAEGRYWRRRIRDGSVMVKPKGSQKIQTQDETVERKRR